MIRKITVYSLLCFLWLEFSSCKEDATAPAKPTFSVDKTSALAFDEPVTFTIDQVNADAVVLLPEGQDSNTAGVTVNSFVDGQAIVQYTYSHVGTFNAVVVASNWSDNGESVERSYSETVQITITSDHASLLTFGIGDLTGEIDEDTKTVDITLPYDPYGIDGITALAAKFTASPYGTVKVGGTTQASGTTTNDFSNPVVYTVTSQDGTESNDYTVNVTVTPVSDDNTVKSAGGKVASKAGEDDPYKEGDSFSAYVDNSAKLIAVVLPYDFPTDVLDSIRLSLTLNSEFADATYGTAAFKQDTLLNLTTSKTVKVKAQNDDEVTYKVIAVIAPKLQISFEDLNPVVNGATKGFAIGLNVLEGTDLSSIATTSVTSGGTGTVTGITAKEDGGTATAFSSGNSLDFSGPVEFMLTVDAGGDVYKVPYTATATVLP